MNTKLKLTFLSLSIISISLPIWSMNQEYPRKRSNPYIKSGENKKRKLSESEGYRPHKGPNYLDQKTKEINREFHYLAVKVIPLNAKIPEIDRLLKDHDINTPNPINQNVLHRVISEHNLDENHKAELLSFLVAHGADILQKDTLGKTPLHLCTSKGSKILKALLNAKNKVNINVQDTTGETPLHWAIKATIKEDEKIKTINLLLKYGARVGTPCNKDKNNGATPLHLATSQGSFILELLLNKDLQYNINVQDYEGETPLHWAVEAKNDNKIEIIDLLIAHEATVDMPCHKDTNSGATPLHLATMQKSSILEQLLKSTHKYNINVANYDGRTPLHWAVAANTSEDEKIAIINLLIAHGARVDILCHKDINNRATPLHLATLQKSSILEQLLKSAQECDINVQDHKGRTPLHWAVTTNTSADEKIALINLLINRGSDLLIRTNEYNSILHDAAIAGAGKAMYHIITNHIKNEDSANFVNLQGNKGRTAFHWALRRTYGPKKNRELLSFEQLFDVLTALIMFHPDCHNLKDCEGRSIVDWIDNYEQNRNIKKSEVELLRKIVAACDSDNDYVVDAILEKNNEQLTFTIDPTFGCDEMPIVRELKNMGFGIAYKKNN